MRSWGNAALTYYVYILTNRPHGTLYIGVTNNNARRITEHRDGKGSRFAHKYNLRRLVYVEPYDTVEEAIAREKAMKEWQRAWKVRLIEEHNPEWDDLYGRLNW
ncbi:GIY-YIG nuclease family protein [Kordiimonas lipolytica]|uniref:GIY-YIG nuclease family protein n=1 Tax=Kordiimonas lipolytica TaxID=1662421 RepID=A0ABV8UBI1_9PROT|nr:GIY-YIG nuclease family protein [Kordiimonas lipolytica]